MSTNENSYSKQAQESLWWPFLKAPQHNKLVLGREGEVRAEVCSDCGVVQGVAKTPRFRHAQSTGLGKDFDQSRFVIIGLGSPSVLGH